MYSSSHNFQLVIDNNLVGDNICAYRTHHLNNLIIEVSPNIVDRVCACMRSRQVNDDRICFNWILMVLTQTALTFHAESAELCSLGAFISQFSETF